MNDSTDNLNRLNAPANSDLAMIDHLMALHERAETTAWNHAPDAPCRRIADEAFNVAVWNHGPHLWLLLKQRLLNEQNT